MPEGTNQGGSTLHGARPGARPSGSLAQSRLVDEDDDSAFFRSFFFRTSQRLCVQRWMADSLRSTARPEGRWQQKPSATRIRQTWLSLYERAKSRLINARLACDQ